MKSKTICTVTFSLPVMLALASCQSAGGGGRNQDLQRQLDETRARLKEYESTFGKLPPSKPRHDFRDLKTRLLGKDMHLVVATIGKPSRVFSLGNGREAWDYYNAAQDNVTGRPVRDLQIWFTNKVVDRIEASF